MSAATTGLLQGVGQALGIAGKMGLENQYETLRQDKRQKYDMDKLEKRTSADNARADLQYERNVGRDEVNNTRAVANEETRFNNNLAVSAQNDTNANARQDSQNTFNTENSKVINLYSDGNGGLTEEGAGMPVAYQKADGSIVSATSTAKGSENRAQKENHAWLKRKQQLEDQRAEGTITDETFDALMAEARIDYKQGGQPQPSQVTKEQVLAAFMKKNNLDEATAVDALSKSEKYGEMFGPVVEAPPSGNGLLNGPSMADRKARAEEIKNNNRLEYEKAFEKERREKQYKIDSENTLSLIEKYKATQN